MKNIAIILASGTGTRSGFDIPKQFIKISNRTIFEMSISIFEENKSIDEIYIVVYEKFVELAKKLIKQNKFKKIKKIINGGKTRKESSFNGVMAIDECEANILIHDCVRPFVTQKIINNILSALKTNNAVNVAIPVVDTTFVENNGYINTILNRATLMNSQTPQSFKLSIIKKAHELAKINNDEDFTDDCGLIQKYNLTPIYIVDGDKNNIKITYPEDFEFAKLIEKNYS